MKITIVTVTYNCKNKVEKTIQSVLSQTYEDIEYIIVDGKSCDGTLDVIRKYSENISEIISEPDNGVYDAMNKAAKLAKGEWVNFMNAGDTFVSPDVVSKLFSTDISNVGVLFGDTLCVGQNGTFELRYQPNWWKHKIMPSCHQSIFVRRDVLKRFPFDLRFKVCADCDSFVRMRKAGIYFKYNPVLVARYDTIGEGISRGLGNVYLEEILSIRYSNRIMAKASLLFYEFRNRLSYLKHLILKGWRF